jgi:putative DNA primase/helicase
VANGTIDLRTGGLQPGKPGDYIRTIAPIEWQGIDIQAPRWEQFLGEVFDGDGELISFVQRLLGYGLTGLSTEHIMAVLWGVGRNGKDTLLEALSFALGGLARPVGAEVLLSGGRSPHAATPYLYDMRFCRLAWVNETSEGVRLDAGQVKLITGGGSITARQLYGKPITYRPKHLLLLVTNHKPHAPADDYALWKRLLLIPFTQSFVDDPKADHEHQRDPHLGEKLRDEAPGILAWLVRGCLAWQQEGLSTPHTVSEATEKYREDEDIIGQFVGEGCELGDGVEVKASKLYATYREWADEYGLTPISVTAFGIRMSSRFEKVKRRDGNHYRGIGIEESEDDIL